jgi:hypothetical protein
VNSRKSNNRDEPTRLAGSPARRGLLCKRLACPRGRSGRPRLPKLSAREIRAFFTGKIFSDGTHFSNRYEADGKIDGFAMGKKVSNTVSGGGKDVLTGAVVLTAREPQRFLRAALDTPPFKKS